MFFLEFCVYGCKPCNEFERQYKHGVLHWKMQDLTLERATVVTATWHSDEEES